MQYMSLLQTAGFWLHSVLNFNDVEFPEYDNCDFLKLSCSVAKMYLLTETKKTCLKAKETKNHLTVQLKSVWKIVFYSFVTTTISLTFSRPLFGSFGYGCREMSVMFGKLSVNFRKLSGKTWNCRLLHFRHNLHSTFPSMFWIFQSGNKLLNNWLDCLYEKCKSLGPSYRPHCGRSIRQGLGLYIFPYRRSNQLLRR